MVHQVSTDEVDMKRAFQFQKFDAQGAARIRRLHEQQQNKGEQQLPDVDMDGFPEYRAYRGLQPWTVIHGAQVCMILVPEISVPSSQILAYACVLPFNFPTKTHLKL
jgi:hypothetical protein